VATDPSRVRDRCVLDCVSPACLSQEFDTKEFEEGEIDLRSVGFQACALAEIAEKRRRGGIVIDLAE
jgi:hypothetical protein